MSRPARRLVNLTRGLLLTAAGILAPTLAGGCVSQQQYDKLSSANKALEERNVLLQQDAEAKQAAMNQLRQRIADGDSTLTEAQRRNAELNSELLGIKTGYDNLGKRLNDYSNGVLDPAVDKALRELAAAHPELIKYDPAHGMVQFASDLTFASGSIEVKAEAKTSLEQFAKILVTNAGGNYDIRIVGHTDNVPVSRPETKAHHPTNTYLSAHRAIAVRDVMQGMGVGPERMEIAGWGQFRPVVANPATGGAAQNRRVEIFLVPSTHSGSVSESAEAPAPKPAKKPAAKAPEEVPMK